MFPVVTVDNKYYAIGVDPVLIKGARFEYIDYDIFMQFNYIQNGK